MDQIGLFESTSQYIAQHINELVEMGSPVLCYLHSTIHIVVPAHMPGCRDENDSGIDGLQQQIEISSSPLNFSIDFQSFQQVECRFSWVSYSVRPSVHATMALICVSADSYTKCYRISQQLSVLPKYPQFNSKGVGFSLNFPIGPSTFSKLFTMSFGLAES